MKKNNDLSDSFVKFLESSFSSAVNVKNEISNIIRNQVDSILTKLNFVKHEEFIVLKKLCQENQKQIKLLNEKINKKKVNTKSNAKKPPKK